MAMVLRNPAGRAVTSQIVRPLIPHLFPSLPISSPPLPLRPRPVRTPCIPFFRDLAHITSTKRLYRQVLRATYRFPIPSPTSNSNPDISSSSVSLSERGLAGFRFRAIRDWHRYCGNTSPGQTGAFLASQTSLVDLLIATTPSSPDYPALLARDFALHLSHTRHLARMAFTSNAKLAALSRPAHLTGGFLRPSTLNPPLPRLRPQPIGISMMMRNRRLAHERRLRKRKEWEGYASDMAAEVGMWKMLGVGKERKTGEGKWEGTGWALGTREMLRLCDAGWAGDTRRKGMMFKEGMRRRVGRAKVRREGWWRDRAEARRLAMVTEVKSNRVDKAEK